MYSPWAFVGSPAQRRGIGLNPLIALEAVLQVCIYHSKKCVHSSDARGFGRGPELTVCLPALNLPGLAAGAGCEPSANRQIPRDAGQAYFSGAVLFLFSGPPCEGRCTWIRPGSKRERLLILWRLQPGFMADLSASLSQRDKCLPALEILPQLLPRSGIGVLAIRLQKRARTASSL